MVHPPVAQTPGPSPLTLQATLHRDPPQLPPDPACPGEPTLGRTDPQPGGRIPGVPPRQEHRARQGGQGDQVHGSQGSG